MKKILPIGTTGTAAYDISSFNCKIKKGDKITIIGIDNMKPSRGYKISDEYGNYLAEIGFDCIIPDQNQNL